MIENAPSIQATEQARLELSVAASAAERANRPRHLLALACLALIGAVIYLGFGLFQRAGARAKIAGARDQARQITDALARLEAASAGAVNRGLDPDAYMNSKIQALANTAGLTLNGTVTDQEISGASVPGMQQKRYSASGTNQDPEAIFAWLNSTRIDSSVRGLELRQLQLRPGGLSSSGQPGWSFDVDFVRWERKPR